MVGEVALCPLTGCGSSGNVEMLRFFKVLNLTQWEQYNKSLTWHKGFVEVHDPGCMRVNHPQNQTVEFPLQVDHSWFISVAAIITDQIMLWYTYEDTNNGRTAIQWQYQPLMEDIILLQRDIQLIGDQSRGIFYG
ncbi:hypothetical protein GOBAR_AA14814 [Gossypium barbadense]|uniref:Uncharacterized protein n=1 Tax=Gossypium barbadense TaxID=3634 RepID=A0A2P5XR46_GOSBA|nr:hypothetical protein GOBAR_AA14814 [Gossypium barbadense]